MTRKEKSDEIKRKICEIVNTANAISDTPQERLFYITEAIRGLSVELNVSAWDVYAETPED